MNQANWRQKTANSAKRRGTPARLAVEALESRSLLAGMPGFVAVEFLEIQAGQDFRPVFEARGFSASGMDGVRSWSAQEAAPRASNIVILITTPVRPTPPATDAASGPSSGKPSGDGGGRPAFGYPFGIPNHRPPADIGEGEAPDTPPATGGFGGNSNSIGGRPDGKGTDSLPPSGSVNSRPAPGLGGGLGTTGNLGTSGNLGVTGGLGSPGSNLGTSGGLNSPNNSLPPVGGSSNTPNGGSTNGSTAPTSSPRSDLALRDAAALGLLSSVSFSTFGGSNDSSLVADIDRVWSSWTQSSSSVLPSNSPQDEGAGRGISLRTVVRSSSSTETTDDDSLDARDKADDDSETDALTATGSRSSKREQVSKRWSRGSRGQQFAQRDWTSIESRNDAALDAVLEEIARTKVTQDDTTPEMDEDGMIELIVVAAADAPAID